MSGFEAVEVEKAVLGACIMDSNRVDEALEAGVTADHFVNTKHRIIWQQLPSVIEGHGMVDEILLLEHLRGEPSGTEGMSLMDQIGLDTISGLTRLESFAAFSRWLALLNQNHEARMFFAHLRQQQEALRERPHSARDLIEETATWLLNTRQADSSQTLRPMETLAHDAYDRLQRERENEEEQGMSTGLIDLDRVFRFKNGTMTVVAARPSMGKSALALRFAIAASQHAPVLLFSLEMDGVQHATRLIAIHGQQGIKRYVDGIGPDPYEMQRIAGEVGQMPIWVEDAAPLNVFRIRATARRMKLRHNIGMVIIDYLQLADADNLKLSREQQISEISRNCKLMSRELGIPVVPLAQLNREVERRDPPHPRLSDLRDSGSIEQDADNVIFIAPTQKGEDGTYRAGGKMLLSIAKQRGGEVGVVPVTFIPQLTTFTNYSREYESEQ